MTTLKQRLANLKDYEIFAAIQLYPLRDSNDRIAIEKALLEVNHPNYIGTLTSKAYSETAKLQKEQFINDTRALKKRLKDLPLPDLKQELLHELSLVDWWSPDKLDTNYSFWLRKEIWLPNEASLLLNGLEPNNITLDKVLKYAKWIDKANEVKEHQEILQSTRDYRKAQQISLPITPIDYINWHNEKGFSLPKNILPFISSPFSEPQQPHTNEKQHRVTPWHTLIHKWISERVESGQTEKPNINTLMTYLKNLAAKGHPIVEETDEIEGKVWFKGNNKWTKKSSIGNRLRTEWTKYHS